jgi:hypothetical protein
MGSAIVNLGKSPTYVRNESQCAAIQRKFTQLTHNPLPPFRVTPCVKLFMQALHFLDEVFRKRQEKGHRVYLGESTVSFLLHEPSQNIQSVTKNSTTPDLSDGEDEEALCALRSLPGFVDGSGAAQEIFPNIL